MKSVVAAAAFSALSLVSSGHTSERQIGEGQNRAADRLRSKREANRKLYAEIPEPADTRQQRRAWAVKEAKRRNRKLVADDRAAQLAAFRASSGTKILRDQEAGREKFRAARRTPSRVNWTPEQLTSSGIHLHSHARQMAAMLHSTTNVGAAEAKAPRKSRAKVGSTETI